MAIDDHWTELSITTTDDDGPTNLYVGAGILCLTPFALYACWKKRPKLTVFFILVWGSWYGYKLSQGDETDIGKRLHLAGQATVILVRAAYEFIVDWMQVLLPFLNDLATWLAPVAAELAEIWSEMDPMAQFITVVSCVGFTLILLCLRCLHKRRAAIKEKGSVAMDKTTRTLFKCANAILFIICGPLCFMLGSNVPPEWGGRLLGTMMTVIPLLFSVRALTKEQQAKNQTKEEASLMDKLRKLNGTSEEEARNEKTALQERIRRWLAYWSVWPVLSVAIIASQGVIPAVYTKDQKEERAKSVSIANGVFLAVVVWATVWDLSKVAPCVTVVLDHFCGACCGRMANRANAKVAEAGQVVARKAWEHREVVAGAEVQSCKDSIAKMIKNKWMVVIIAIAVVVLVGYLVGQTLAMMMLWATWIVLVSAGFETAFIVSREDPDMWHSRLAFWTISAFWVQVLLEIPFLKVLLTVWTPMVVIVAMLIGRQVLDLLLKCLGKAMMTCLRCFFRCTDDRLAAEPEEGRAGGAETGQPQGTAAGAKDEAQVAGTAAEPLLRAAPLAVATWPLAEKQPAE